MNSKKTTKNGLKKFKKTKKFLKAFTMSQILMVKIGQKLTNKKYYKRIFCRNFMEWDSPTFFPPHLGVSTDSVGHERKKTDVI
jgi:hypothetical protein